MKLKKYILSMMTLIATVGMVGCSSSDTSETSDMVIATSVAVAEILDELNVKVGGVPTTSYELPDSMEGAIEVGNPMNPDLEIIKSLNPKVVVSVDTLGSEYEEMFTENNIPSEFINLTSLDGLKNSITQLGEKFDKSEEANSILKELDNKEKELKEKTSEDKPKVMVVFGAPGSMMLGSNNSYVGNIVELAGGENVLESETLFLPINKEELINLNPDKIVVMTHADPENAKKMVQEEFETDVAWKSLNAIKNEEVYYLENGYFGMSANLKVIEALDKMHEILYK